LQKHIDVLSPVHISQAASIPADILISLSSLRGSTLDATMLRSASTLLPFDSSMASQAESIDQHSPQHQQSWLSWSKVAVACPTTQITGSVLQDSTRNVKLTVCRDDHVVVGFRCYALQREYSRQQAHIHQSEASGLDDCVLPAPFNAEPCCQSLARLGDIDT